MKYTATEKLLADTARAALADLDQVFIDMRQQGLHLTDDKNLRILYLGINAALAAQDKTYAAATAIVDAPQALEISRLPAWDGFSTSETPEPKERVKP